MLDESLQALVQFDRARVLKEGSGTGPTVGHTLFQKGVQRLHIVGVPGGEVAVPLFQKQTCLTRKPLCLSGCAVSSFPV